MRNSVSVVRSLGPLVLVPALAVAQVQTKDQQKCTAGMGKGFQKTAVVAAKDIASCVVDGSKGRLPGGVEACVAADRQGRRAAAEVKAAETFEKLCTGTSRNPPGGPRLPPYGVTNAATVASTAVEKERTLAHDVLGANLDTSVLSVAGDSAGAKCQQSILKQVTKCQDAHLKEFVKCVAKGLAASAGAFDAPDDLAGCIGADPAAKIAKQCDLAPDDGLRKTIAKQCVAKGASLAGAVAGCAADTPEATHACLAARVACRVCRGIDAAAGLARDCDLFDDGVTNASCGPQSPSVPHQCLLDAEASGFTFETARFFDIFPLDGSVEIDCGAIDPATGRAACTCSVVDIPPIPIVPNLGVACVRAASGCAPGAISCNGGDAMNGVMTSDHDAGTCAGNAECAASCASHCAAAGASVFDSACEGFCRAGTNDGEACTGDGDCPGGTCNGIAAGTHGHLCQCECLDVGGTPSRPGAMRCNLGIEIDVELAAPCGDGDLLFAVGRRCVPLTTEGTSGTILDANAAPDAQIPAGLETFEGIPRTCGDFTAGGPSGMSLVSSVNALDVDLAGDIAFNFVVTCE